LEDFSKLTSVTILKIEQTLSIPVALIVQVVLFFCFIKMFKEEKTAKKPMLS
jgi:ubiquitin C-terminal hydrolase